MDVDEESTQRGGGKQTWLSTVSIGKRQKKKCCRPVENPKLLAQENRDKVNRRARKSAKKGTILGAVFN